MKNSNLSVEDIAIREDFQTSLTATCEKSSGLLCKRAGVFRCN